MLWFHWKFSERNKSNAWRIKSFYMQKKKCIKGYLKFHLFFCIKFANENKKFWKEKKNKKFETHVLEKIACHCDTTTKTANIQIKSLAHLKEKRWGITCVGWDKKCSLNTTTTTINFSAWMIFTVFWSKDDTPFCIFSIGLWKKFFECR